MAGAPDPNVNQFRTIDGVKYVDGEAQLPNSQPDPYREIPNWPQLPAGRKLSAISAIGAGPDGNIWVADRCVTGPGACSNSELAPIFEFDASGKMLKNFGAGLFVYPHGLWVDKDGNVWVADARGSNGKGNQVIKFSPDGKVLLKLGKAGEAGLTHDTFNGPCALVTAPNGDIFVADGHENTVSRIMKFNKDGKFLMEWGKKGTGQVNSTPRTRWRWIRKDGCLSAIAPTAGFRSFRATGNCWKSGGSSGVPAGSISMATTSFIPPTRSPTRPAIQASSGAFASEA